MGPHARLSAAPSQHQSTLKKRQGSATKCEAQEEQAAEESRQQRSLVAPNAKMAARHTANMLLLQPPALARQSEADHVTS